MKTVNKTTQTTVTQSSGEDATEVRIRNARRAERAQKIAQLAKSGSPMAAATLAQHNKVNELEDALARERGMLMGILKHVKLA